MKLIKKIVSFAAAAAVLGSLVTALPAAAEGEAAVTITYSDDTSLINDAAENTDYKFETGVARAMTVKGLYWIVENYTENSEKTDNPCTSIVLDWGQTFTIPENVVIQLPATLGTGNIDGSGANPIINGAGVIKAAKGKQLIAVGKNFKLTVGGSVTLEGTGDQVGIMSTSDTIRYGVTVKENATLKNFTTAIQHSKEYDSENKGSWVYIEGGTFESNTTDIDMKYSGSKLKISGGVFKDELNISNATYVNESDSTNCSSITGGTFMPGVTFPVAPTGTVTFDVSKVVGETTLATLPENTTIESTLVGITNGDSGATYPITINNNVVTVNIVDSAVAVVGDNRYNNLSDAITAASGAEVKVIKDCTLEGCNPKMNVTLTADTPVVISGDSAEYLLYSKTTKISGPITLKNTNEAGYVLKIDWKDYSAELDGITIGAASGNAVYANCAHSLTIKGDASINGTVTLVRTDGHGTGVVDLTNYTGTNPIQLVMNDDLLDANGLKTDVADKVVVKGTNYTFTDDTYEIDSAGKLTLKTTPTAPEALLVKADFSVTNGSEGYSAADGVLSDGTSSIYGYKATLTGNGTTYNTVKAHLKASDETEAKPDITYTGATMSDNGDVVFYVVVNKTLDTTVSKVYCE